MWTGVDVVRPARVRPFIGAKKVMIWACFSRSGIENIILLLLKEAFDREFFVEKVLANFDKERMRNRLRKCSRDTFFHLNNVIPHRTPRNFDRLGIRRFLHPLYSQDLASCDFWLFGTLKRKLEGSTFGDPVEVFDEWKCRFSA
jgi:hypothetical protein